MNRPDASMTLLRDLQEGALEPEYRQGSRRPPSRLRFGFTVTLLVLLITVAALQTTRGAGTAADQRAQLLERIASARTQQAELSARVTSLEGEIRDLGDAAIGDPAEQQRQEALEAVTGAVAVTGEGVIVEVGDAPGASNAQGLVLDSDLTRLVNGLWEAGAEAVSINGQRLTVLTPIRSAGAAITVDYVSLSPPYTLQAIGDPATLPARFNETDAAQWWHYLTQNYGLTLSIKVSEDDLELPADSGMTLRYAERG
ncbi:DUF881 domain-containing protein [Tessaracoccus palaemonis]|uniref:DUF881 domain-containing protein n=1 Tax=Tessaracoccus palaemonis TaxID=2829499 RepID=A0ABX8SE67_9ACTN|nr:DUF881 domain-containing protein [Tessaracoccus palaemonis]QXT61671.1 DUF881 domain-containing protein [Tessaracoccus palaemonis]